MRTLAVLMFIASAAGTAIWLARRPTVADGRVVAADLLAQLREHGVTAMACDPAIPIGRQGAVFGCTATLASGELQQIEYAMDRAGSITARVGAAGPGGHRIPASADPWAN